MSIVELDTYLFLKIQNSIVGANRIIDEIFLAISNYSLIFFAAAAVFLLIHLMIVRKPGWHKQIFIIIIAIAVPTIISYFGRPVIGRPRPFLVLDFEPLLTHTGYVSFPSNHATAAFAVAMAVFAYNRKAGIVLMVPALLTALSRVYVGVHYPLDIIAGGLLGIILAWAIIRCPRLLRNKTGS